MAKTFHPTIRIHALHGEVNRSDEIYVPCFLHSDEEKGFVWIKVTKTAVKDALDELKEAGLEEVEGVTVEEEDGEKTLYLDGPGAEPDEEGEGEKEEEESEEEEPEET
jgi:hypothetical protein